MLESEFINYSLFSLEAFAELEKKLKIEKLGLVQKEGHNGGQRISLSFRVMQVWSHKT